jgi:hypothetical protein
LCTLHVHRYRYPRNTQYGWLTKPYPARTFTLSEMPSLLGVRYQFITENHL